MSQISVDEVRSVVEKIRVACERASRETDENSDYPSIASFPLGFCQHARNIIGHHLHEDYKVPCEDMTLCFDAWREDWSHAWLEWNGYIIDITDDQFDDVDQCSYVTTDREWHNQFKKTKRRVFDPTDPDEDWAFLDLYQFVMSFM